MDHVALIEHKGDVRKTIEEGVKFIGGWGLLESPFVIKPNIAATVAKSESAVTDAGVVHALIELVLEQKADISIKIVESDSEGKFIDEAFVKFGYKSLEKEFKASGFDVSLVNLSRMPTTSVNLEGLHFRNPELPNIVAESGYFVSIAVAKTHHLTFVTGTLKNLFGLLPKKEKAFYHPFIDEVIVGINKLVKPDLCIVDARMALEGWEGPTGKHLNKFVLGRNPVSVDATMVRIMGFRPEKIRHIVEAAKYDLGTLDPDVLGEKIESLNSKVGATIQLVSYCHSGIAKAVRLIRADVGVLEEESCLSLFMLRSSLQLFAYAAVPFSRSAFSGCVSSAAENGRDQ